MPVQSMQCPICGKEASEYAPDKWPCHSCQSKFIFESPPEEILVKQTLNQTIELEDKGMIYECEQRKGRFSKLSQANQICRKCHKLFCPSCFGRDGDSEFLQEKRKSKKSYCIPCYKHWKLHRWDVPAKGIQSDVTANLIVGFIFFFFVMFLVFIMQVGWHG